MDNNIIISIAKDRILSDLCFKWYVETDDEQKKIIFEGNTDYPLNFYTRIIIFS